MKDKNSFIRILKSETSKLWKFLGNNINTKYKYKWLDHICQIVLEIVDAKYMASSVLSTNLLKSYKKLIVRSSEYDFIIGNGFNIYNTCNKRPSMWFGSNLLGYAIMTVRDKIHKNPDKYIKKCSFWAGFMSCIYK